MKKQLSMAAAALACFLLVMFGPAAVVLITGYSGIVDDSSVE